MPSASMMILASPLLIGPAPVNAAIEVAAVSGVEIEALTAHEVPFEQPAQTIMALDWALAPQNQSTDDQAGSSPTDAVDEKAGEATADGADQDDPDVIVVEGEIGPRDSDPAAVFNETSYRLTQDLDEVFLEPVAYAYRDGLPDPLRDGLGNVVKNLSEPTNFINFLLQGKFGKAFETLGRFAINSSVGLGGLIDIAGKKNIGLPYRRNGFANTLGFYGIEPGAYLYLPVTGATTVRDLVGNAFNQFPLPVLVGKPFNTPEYTIPFFVISSLDARLEVDEELERIDATIDPYAARRESYLWTRERDIALLKGEPVPPKPNIVREVLDGDLGVDPLDEEEALEDLGTEPGEEDADEPKVQPSDAPPIMGEAEVDAGTVAITRLR